MASGQGSLTREVFDQCRCKKMGESHWLCHGEHGFEEKGKAVFLHPKRGESCEAIVLDECVFPDYDSDPRCDGVFLLWGTTRKALVLVELKGANHIQKAFKQLAYVRNQRAEYAYLRSRLQGSDKERVQEMAFIIMNGSINKPEKERLEHYYGIPVREVVQSEATKPKPNLRDRLQR